MNTPTIKNLVEAAGRARFRFDLKMLWLRCWMILGASFAAAILIDAVYGLPVLGLLLLDSAMLVIIFAVLRPMVLRVRKGRDGNRHTAIWLEQKLAIPDNQLINALDLSEQDTEATSSALRNEAIILGEAAAKQRLDEPVTDPGAMNKPANFSALMLAGLVLAYLIYPSVFHAVLPRLVAPYADHPPFTSVRFHVNVHPEPIYYGKPAAIRVAVAGPRLPEQAQIVFVEEGVKSTPLPMYRVHNLPQDIEAADTKPIFAMRIERVESSRQFYIDTPRGRSKLHTLIPDTAPLIESASVTYDYPDYTGWPDTTGPFPHSGLRALRGTRVTINMVSNVPLREGGLGLMPDDDSVSSFGQMTEAFIVDKSDPRSASVTFELLHTGRFRANLYGLDGRAGVRRPNTKMVALPDRAPKIDIVHPEQQAVVPEGWPVETEVSAGDDIGLDSVVMHLGVNDSPTKPTVLPLTFIDVNQTVAQSGHTFDPAKLGAQAGDTLRYYATVRDSHPVTPQSAETPVHAIHIITMQQYLDLARTQYRIDDLNQEFDIILERLAFLEDQRDQLLDQLAELQQQLSTGEPLTDEQLQQIAELEAALGDYAQQAAAMAEELRERAEQATLYDFEDAYKQMLSELRSQLESQGDQAQSLASALKDLQHDDAQTRRQVVGLQADRFALSDEPFTGSMREQTELAEQDLEKLRLAEAMLAQGERIRRVAQDQDALAVKMSGLSDPGAFNTEERARAEALAREQATLRDELSEASKALRDASEQARDNLPKMSSGAAAVADKIEDLRIVPTQTAAQKASLAGNGPLAHQAARDAADKLDSLLSDVNQGQSQASGDLDGCFNLPRQQMQNALKQMAAGRGLPSMGTQGGSGVGMSGASGQMTMMGPAVPGQFGGDSLAREGRRGGQDGRGRSISGSEDAVDPAEVLHADASRHGSQAVGQYPGVPVEYREQAEAYFKRIAEEQK